MMTSAHSRERYRRRMVRIMEVRAILAERFPACFARKGRNKRPIAIGVTETLVHLCPDLAASDIRAAIGDYAAGPTYLRNLVAGADRIGLQGEPCGTVSDGQAEYAAGRLRHVEKRIAEQQARAKAARATVEASLTAAGAP